MESAGARPGAAARKGALAEWAATGFMVALAGMLLAAIAAMAPSADRGGGQSAARTPATAPTPEMPAAGLVPRPGARGGIGYILIVTSEGHATKLRALLEAEEGIRATLGEEPRIAAVAAAATDAEARVIAEAVLLDAGPHAFPVVPVIVGAMPAGAD